MKICKTCHCIESSIWFRKNKQNYCTDCFYKTLVNKIYCIYAECSGCNRWELTHLNDYTGEIECRTCFEYYLSKNIYCEDYIRDMLGLPIIKYEFDETQIMDYEAEAKIIKDGEEIFNKA